MTDQPQPLHMLIAGLDLEAVCRSLAPITERLARVRFRNAAHMALTACLDGDHEQAARILAGLDAAQLYAIEGAASGLAIHASRLRKDPDANTAQDDEQDGAGCPLDCPPGQCKADPFPDDGVAAALALGRAASESWTRNSDPAQDADGAEELRSEIAQIIRDANGSPEALAAWRQHPHLVPADVYAAALVRLIGAYRDETLVAQQRADDAEREQRRLSAERDDAHRRAETLRASRDEIREKLRQADAAHGEAVAEGLRAQQRAEDAERELATERRRNHYQRAEQAEQERAAVLSHDEEVTRLLKRAERRADEQQTRAQRAEAEAADWRTVAVQYERERDEARRIAADNDRDRRAEARRAAQAGIDGRNLLKALDVERGNYATWQQRAKDAEREQRRLADRNAALDRAIGDERRGRLAAESKTRRVEGVLAGKTRLCGPDAVEMVSVKDVRAALNAEASNHTEENP